MKALECAMINKFEIGITSIDQAEIPNLNKLPLEAKPTDFWGRKLIRRIWYGGRGGGRPPWGSRLTLIRARNGGLLGQKDLFLLLDWVIRASFATAAPPSEHIHIRL